MASTTYEHPGGVTEMYATHGRFRDLTKTYHLGNTNKTVTFCHRFAVIGSMVRNAGQLPQPFWLGGTFGGGSHSAARCAARA